MSTVLFKQIAVTMRYTDEDPYETPWLYGLTPEGRVYHYDGEDWTEMSMKESE